MFFSFLAVGMLCAQRPPRDDIGWFDRLDADKNGTVGRTEMLDDADRVFRNVDKNNDGDGKTDIAVFRDGFWYILQSRDGFTGAQFGLGTDKPVLGDYDGDGKADLAVWRPSNGGWYYRRSSDAAFRGTAFGTATDIPAPGDYDGDGKFDYVVFRPSDGNWYVLQNANNAFRVQPFGTNGDAPLPAANLP